VEDQPDNLKLITALLGLKGHQVIGLASGSRLVDTVRTHQPTPALILLDIQLPGRDGFQLLADLQALEGDHPWKVVALTAHAMAGDREACLQAGMDGYLSKPIRKLDLLEAINATVPPAPANIEKPMPESVYKSN